MFFKEILSETQYFNVKINVSILKNTRSKILLSIR